MVGGKTKTFGYIFSMSKIFFLFLFALFMPRIFVTYINTKTCNLYKRNADFSLGIENITHTFISRLKKNHTNLNTCLITNETGKDQLGRSNISILKNMGLHIKHICKSEQEIKILDTNNLKDIDIIIFDIQTAGVRHYTHITTLFQAIDKAATHKKTLIILDRPNLLGPIIEGPISIEGIPLRYGMTIGEVAFYYNNKISKIKARLHIVPMKGYKRDSHITNKLMSGLSDGIPGISSCHGYSFLGLLKEVEPFWVAVGTKNAYQVICLPENIHFPKEKWQVLHKMLYSYGVKSSFYRFFDKSKNNYCSGLKVMVSNIHYTKSFTIFISILKFFKNNKIELTFSKNFDAITGTSKVRKFLENKISWKKLSRSINKKLYIFYNQAYKYFIYKPYPQIEYL